MVVDTSPFIIQQVWSGVDHVEILHLLLDNILNIPTYKVLNEVLSNKWLNKIFNSNTSDGWRGFNDTTLDITTPSGLVIEVSRHSAIVNVGPPSGPLNNISIKKSSVIGPLFVLFLLFIYLFLWYLWSTFVHHKKIVDVWGEEELPMKWGSMSGRSGTFLKPAT